MSVRQLTVVLVCFVCTALVAAQRIPEPPSRPQPVPQFRAGVELVRLDVSVLDRNRRPVRGLTPADFTLLENGVPQKIAAFNAVDIPVPGAPAIAWMREVAPDVRSNEGMDERRLFLILLDDATIQGDPCAIANVRTLRSSDRPARAIRPGSGGVHARQPELAGLHERSRATADGRRQVHRRVSRHGEGGGRRGADDLYFMYSVNVIESAVEILSTLPDRRKSIIYIGQGVPVDLGSAATPQQPGLAAGGGPRRSRRPG